jgi:hypothetical protein
MSLPSNVTASGNLVSSLPYIRWALAQPFEAITG